jgi:hypothetical protein
MGRYYGDVREAFARAGFVGWLLAASWLLYPVAIQTVLHPSDAIGLQYWLQGQPVPHFFTVAMLRAGEITALIGLVVLSLFVLGLTVLFYRRADYMVWLWPLAGLLLGVAGNGGWWISKGFFDGPGALAGWAPLALMVIGEGVCERMGADFVFGKGNRPGRQSWGL